MARQHRARDETEHPANVNQSRHEPVPASREDDRRRRPRSAARTSSGTCRSADAGLRQTTGHPRWAPCPRGIHLAGQRRCRQVPRRGG